MNTQSRSTRIDSPTSPHFASPDLPASAAEAGRSVEEQLKAIRNWMAWLVAGIFLVALALLLFVAAVFAAEIDYHYGEYKLIAGACTGGVVMGFLFGWLAHQSWNPRGS